MSDADLVAAVLDAAYLEHMSAWNLETFGPGARTEGIFDHIRKELKEILDDPADIVEWSDLLLLALNGAMRAGHEPQQIIDSLRMKQAINEQRTWPDWRTQDPNKAIEHVRYDAEVGDELSALTETDQAAEECWNCDGRKCMDCVCRHHHDQCVEDCPRCCVREASAPRCGSCHGRGRFGDAECRTCDGTGEGYGDA